MKKIVNWDFASKLAVVFGIIGGLYLIFQIYEHFTSEERSFNSEINISEYNVPINKQESKSIKWRDLRKIITQDFDSYYLSRSISDSLIENMKEQEINESYLIEIIENAIPEEINRDDLVDKIDSMLSSTKYPMIQTNYFVSTFIKNQSNHLSNKMRLEIPTKGYFELYINESLVSDGEFENNIHIGELRPDNLATLKIWAFDYVSTFDLTQNKIKYTFENGYLIPTAVEAIAAEGFIYWVYKNKFWAFYFLILLPLNLLIIFFSKKNQPAKNTP